MVIFLLLVIVTAILVFIGFVIYCSILDVKDEADDIKRVDNYKK